ncbi:Acyl-CoA synthetase (AMP-forming)/AMP-acid ligase II [Oribacterium sp. KHPX15]|uniref:AMP-binding protein n=1 Tax=Oribacterium sp. KHPX15 TaxID=1855342 RepID=UPI000894B957|nr:AMP-binding protein [Oribacterium sp. KHPX15]SDZ98629.1 Acyl-CoA synthetase (AMP-forming)/AMP-acid ligase II [Oribacterium sp. KHPX15]
MKRYLDLLSRVFETIPERAACVDGDETITYGEMDIESARIYRYLKEHNIGKEDFVYIIMPKNCHFISCMIGVWKAGAAYVMNEPGYPPERVEYICKDTDAKLILDMELFNEIMYSCEPLSGYEETDVHDAAYAIYTSGSTGNPKGVLHEYGNLDQMGSYVDTDIPYPETRHGLVPPTSFVACVCFIISYSLRGRTFYMVSGELLRNQPEFCRFIEENELEEVYIPPSYIRIYKDPAPSLKLINTGSEPANGLYYEGGKPQICNFYGMSESGFPILTTILDKAYDVAPAGKPVVEGLDLRIIDDDGKIINGPGMGELCYRNEYVRGYIHLPEKTAQAFVNGIFHSGDLCRRDENGIYYLCGRKDDMFKINGNRIEPAEIEAQVQRITGLEKVVAKGFDENHHQFICVYYLEDEAKRLGIFTEGDLEFDREKLLNALPSYMMPSYFIPLKAFPLNINGKIAKKELKSPDASRYISKNKPPVSEGEKYFCEIFARLLDIPAVGRDDDFFMIGGDSVLAIRLVQLCDRYDLDVNAVYSYRTPELLAENAKKKEDGESADYSERMAEGYRDENISGGAFYGAFVNNVTSDTVIMLKKESDIPLLEKALFTVYRNYPFYHQHLEAENGRLYYVRDVEGPKVYTPEMPVDREDRIRVIADGKKLLVKIPHSFTDGFGMHLFLQLFLGTYQELLDGKAPDLQKEEVYTPGHYYEIFSEDYSVYGKEVPEVYKNVVGAYRFPEAPDEKEKDTGKRYHYTVKIKLDKLPALSEEQSKELSSVGGGATVVVADMIAKAIKDIHPEAEKIGCRTSVNLRSIMKHEDSLKNMSMGLAVFFPGEDGFQQLTEALTPEVLKWQLMKFRLMIDGKLDASEDKMLIGSIINTTFAVTNMIGNGQKNPDIVESIESENASPVPLLVMIGNEGNEISISFIQKFESRVYFDRFCEILSEYDR